MKRLTSLLLIGACAAAMAGDNLLNNSDFTAGDNGLGGWRVVKSQTVRIEAAEGDAEPARALRVDIDHDGGESYGQIGQKVKVSPRSIYRFEGMLKGSKNGLAFYQIKLIRGRKELKRISTDNNTTAWQTVSKELSTGEADTVEVICRYRQSAKHKWVGETAWFAAPSLVLVGPDANATPPAKPATGAQGALNDAGRPTVNPEPLPAGGDIYVTPDGAGSKDGSSWEQAMAGKAEGGLQAAWDATGPASVCHVGSGEYGLQSVTLSSGHDVHGVKTLRGEDTGNGLPVFRGTWHQQKPDTGPTFITVPEGVSHWQVEGLRIENYQLGVRCMGRHVDIRMQDLHFAATRDGIVLVGGASEADPAIGTHDVLIRGCTFNGFTKRAVRMFDGVYMVRIVDCVADAGGKAFATEPFQMCFHVGGGSGTICDHDISYINVTAMNAYNDAGDKYWNGDGFAAERHAYNLSYINCRSRGHTDGGWDDKSHNPILVDCLAVDNKRNFRLWSAGGALLVRCTGAYANLRGGTGTAAGLFLAPGAQVRVIDSAFYNNAIQLDVDNAKAPAGRRARLEVIASTIGSDLDKPGVPYTLEEGADLKLDGITEYTPDSVPRLPTREELMSRFGSVSAPATDAVGAN